MWNSSSDEKPNELNLWEDLKDFRHVVIKMKSLKKRLLNKLSN